MKAIILAAGTASRLRPLTLHTPKCLLKVGERTLLQRSMDALIEAGIREFVIVTGYLHEQIENFVRETYQNFLPLREGRGGSVCFIHNKDYETTNNIYSLWLARPEAEGEGVLLLDSDLLYDAEIVKRVLADKHENVLTLIRHELGEEEMKVVMAPDGSITEISKTCDPALAAGESLGIERMGKAYTSALYKELDTMMDVEHLENKFYELAFQRLIAKGQTLTSPSAVDLRFSVLDVTDLFSCELDTVEDFENAKQRIPAHLF
ncbi:MAG: phosphocholine cytidylyltransferase family protein [Bacteroidaceae bacterium]|nr:phosphocholine cytidylyltransferase family protein [Bacteroidaceae bacterium]